MPSIRTIANGKSGAGTKTAFEHASAAPASTSPDSSVAIMKGWMAQTMIDSKYSSQSQLSEAINEMDEGASIDSCHTTALLLSRKISNNELVHEAIPRGAAANETSGKVIRYLTQSNMVVVSIVPDHHFTIIPISAHKVRIYQGFQDVYNLSEWLEMAGGGGVMTYGVLRRRLENLLCGNASPAIGAATDLFGWNTVDDGINKEIQSYYSRGDIRAINIARKPM